MSERPFLRVLVTGSTTWDKLETIRRELSQLPPHSVIVTGDTPGADACARGTVHMVELARQRCSEVRIFRE